MKLLKLYSEPEIFTPIVFETGVNIILGEKVDNQTISNRKTNGVGKSVCIEMIQFCLMKTFDKSNRIFRIPKTVLEQKKGDLLLQLNTLLFRMQAFQESFQETILKIHERIMGNRKAAFMILTQQKTKTSIEFEMRVDADGSHSVDRTKVFIYDMALMFNEFTQKRHPKFLIHDNIFDVDQDTLIQSLHFLLKQEDLHDDFQYILTLNKDKIENELKNNQILLVDRHFKAIFTKSKKFLKQDYQEI